MKFKNKSFYHLSIIFYGILIFISCTDTDNEIIEASISKVNIEKAPLKVQIDYANKHLLEIGKIISKLSHNKEFKSVLYKSSHDKTDNSYYKTILVKDLIDDIYKVEKKKNVFYINDEEKFKLNKSLEAFYDIDGQDWYPEIIIINYREKYNKYKSVENKSSDTNNPIIVPVVYEDNDEATEDAYAAYQEDKNDELVQLDYTVTQSDAETEDILFLKISESCELQEFEGEVGLCSDDPWAGGGGGTTNPKFYLDRMTAKEHYESIGASEVEVKAQGYYVTGHYPISKIKISNTNRHKQYSYSRSKISNKESRYIYNRYIYADPIPNTGEIYYAVMVFEYDAWPAPKETKYIPKTLTNGEVLKIPFEVRSWQGPYNEEIKEGFPTWSFENSSIKYNFLYKY